LNGQATRNRPCMPPFAVFCQDNDDDDDDNDDDGCAREKLS